MNIKSLIRQAAFDIYRLSYFFQVGYIRTRTELPVILNRQGLINRGVEVGVWKGEFSDFLLSKWEGTKLYSVDPWKQFDTTEYDDAMNIGQSAFDDIYAGVQSLLAPYGDRSEIIRQTSQDASTQFPDNSLDFVYLDGRHSYEGLKEDISLWYDKVKSAGILCGHDYLNGRIGDTDFGVKTAVDEFITAHPALKLIVTHKDRYPSWFIVKP